MIIFRRRHQACKLKIQPEAGWQKMAGKNFITFSVNQDEKSQREKI